MGKRRTPLELGRRERQIVETVTRLGEALLGLLVEKNWLKYRRDGRKYLYRPSVSRRKNQQAAISKLIHTFFDGSANDAVAALFDSSVEDLSDEKLKQLKEMIDQAIEDKK